jgi:hypothetical protein
MPEDQAAAALALVEESLATCEALNAPLLRAGLLKYKGDMLASLGRHDEAEAAIEEAILLHATHGDDAGLVVGLIGRSELRMARGDPRGAAAAGRQALPLARQTGRESMLALALVNLSAYLAVDGATPEAFQHAREGLTRAAGYEVLTALALQVLALLQARAGHTRGAARLLGYVDARFAALGCKREETEKAVYARLMELLQASLPSEELELLLKEGGTISLETATAIAGL